MAKITCLGISDKEIRKYKMRYVPHNVPPYAEYSKRRDKFRVLVKSQHLFFLRKKKLFLFNKIEPCFIFNMLDRNSISIYQDADGNEVENTWFLGRSMKHEGSDALDAETANAIDNLIEPAFWTGLRQQMSLGNREMLIYMGFGIGCWLALEWVLKAFNVA